MQADIEAASHVGQLSSPVSTFTQLFSPTRRGARLARLLAEQQLVDWGLPRDADVARNATAIVAELAVNAARHGRVPGRDFRLTLHLYAKGVLRIEVTDARAERLPAPVSPELEDEHGRGLLIVDALAARWGVEHHSAPPASKSVWAELEVAAARFPVGGRS